METQRHTQLSPGRAGPLFGSGERSIGVGAGASRCLPWQAWALDGKLGWKIKGEKEKGKEEKSRRILRKRGRTSEGERRAGCIFTAGTSGGLRGFLMSPLPCSEIWKHPSTQTFSVLSLKGHRQQWLRPGTLEPECPSLHPSSAPNCVPSAGYLPPSSSSKMGMKWYTLYGMAVGLSELINVKCLQ